MATAQNLLDILVSQKLISAAQAKEISLQAAKTGKKAEQIIEEKKLVKPIDLARAKSELFKVPFVSLAEMPVSPEAVSLVSEPIAKAYKLIPISYDRKANELSVAMANPLDLEAIEFLEGKTNSKVVVYMAESGEIKRAINDRYRGTLAAEVSQALKEELAIPKAKPVDIRQLGKVIREAPVAKVVSTILEFAVASRSSDIHIEPQEKRTRVRYRIDGVMHEKLLLPRNIHAALISRIKILSGMKIDEKRIPQDGRFSFTAGSQEVDLRVSTVPTVYGEKVVMRLLKGGGTIPDLPELGLRGLGLKHFEEAIKKPNGIILVCGPTGSGKTTTLYSALTRINTPRVNIMTIEAGRIRD